MEHTPIFAENFDFNMNISDVSADLGVYDNKNLLYFNNKDDYCNGLFSQFMTVDQISCICRSLYRTKDGDKLVDLFFKTDPFIINRQAHSNSVLLAFFFSLYHSQQYDELFRRLESVKVDERYYGEFTNLWYEGHYAQEQMKKPKLLGPVEKYRLRKKFKPPLTISDGEEQIYSFKAGQRKILKNCYNKNKYPKPEEKLQIAQLTKLKPQQIANWFKNRRQRDKPQAEAMNTNMNLNMNMVSFRSLEPTFYSMH
ncbi:unnamed protein product [Bursaphelenchus xylophilus]|uniref:(pine wood nematode) hypothetical protein n=1 Tax=Bursaphelenchus xylophilus TaxID=6326 RepID=A0A1I7RNF2_BURXY|nr:unnamed protein product [Bursaphelenchus xylophilus]CAG9123951.1 unnamed protein product [Bursaphelenchus xylophilus]